MRKLILPGILISTCILLMLFVYGIGEKGDVKTPQTQPDGTGNEPTQQITETAPTEEDPAEESESQSPVIPDEEKETLPDLDFEVIKPDESGKIMIVMFHNFIEEPVAGGDKEYTTTFGDFERLLEDLYERGYRLIGMEDYLNNNISVPAGCIPMMFTFDDGTPGQFSLVREEGKLTVNKRTAVGIMEEFNRKHPDFGMKGVFYVNLGNKTFDGEGTVSERLQYLIEMGFEIGNHTYTHAVLKELTSAESIQKQIGGNQKKMEEWVEGYRMITFSLPKGVHPREDLKDYVIKGQYEGTPYDNRSIVLVGAEPALSPVSVKFDPFVLRRVRASGLEPVHMDLAWWLNKLTREQQYISDGDPATVTVPQGKEAEIDPGKLNGKQLRTY